MKCGGRSNGSLGRSKKSRPRRRQTRRRMRMTMMVVHGLSASKDRTNML
jgi:hypothetical protein